MKLNQKNENNSKKFFIYKIAIIALIVLFLILHFNFQLDKQDSIIIGSILSLLLVSVSLLIRFIFEKFQEEPFTFFVSFLFALLVLLPFLFNLFNIKEIPSIIKGSFSIILPILLNMINDGLFKILETQFDSQGKKKLATYGATLNLIFNSTYIATFLSVQLN